MFLGDMKKKPMARNELKHLNVAKKLLTQISFRYLYLLLLPKSSTSACKKGEEVKTG